MKNVTYDAKSHKKLGLHLSLEDTFLEKPQAGGGGVVYGQFDLPAVLGLNIRTFIN